jgi:excisionase family DNA binding protein
MDQILVSRKEAAKLLGISTRHLIALEQTGRLPKPRLLGRRKLFCVRELELWAAQGCPPADRFQPGGC